MSLSNWDNFDFPKLMALFAKVRMKVIWWMHYMMIMTDLMDWFSISRLRIFDVSPLRGPHLCIKMARNTYQNASDLYNYPTVCEDSRWSPVFYLYNSLLSVGYNAFDSLDCLDKMMFQKPETCALSTELLEYSSWWYFIVPDFFLAQGVRDGFIFKLGIKGLGYYEDRSCACMSWAFQQAELSS